MSRHKKAKSAQAFLLQKSIPAAPCKGLAYGPQAARRTGGQANLRFASAAPPPGLRPAPALRTTPPPTQGEGCVKGGPSAGPPFAFNQGRGFEICKKVCVPQLLHKKAAPWCGLLMEKDSVKENRQGCLSRLIRAGALKSVKRYALPPAPKKNAPGQNAQARPHARGGMCEGRTIGGSSLRVQSGHRPRFCRGYALPPAPKKNAPMGAFFFGAADGN